MKIELKDVIHLYIGCEVELEVYRSKRVAKFVGIDQDVITVYLLPIGGNWFTGANFVTPILRRISSITKEEMKELWKVVFNREFIGNQIIRYEKDVPRWVLSSGVERLGIVENGNVWADSDLQRHNYNKHLVTVFLLKKGFDLFGLIDSKQAVDRNLE